MGKQDNERQELLQEKIRRNAMQRQSAAVTAKPVQAASAVRQQTVRAAASNPYKIDEKSLGVGREPAAVTKQPVTPAVRQQTVRAAASNPYKIDEKSLGVAREPTVRQQTVRAAANNPYRIDEKSLGVAREPTVRQQTVRAAASNPYRIDEKSLGVARETSQQDAQTDLAQRQYQITKWRVEQLQNQQQQAHNRELELQYQINWFNPWEPERQQAVEELEAVRQRQDQISRWLEALEGPKTKKNFASQRQPQSVYHPLGDGRARMAFDAQLPAPVKEQDAFRALTNRATQWGIPSGLSQNWTIASRVEQKINRIQELDHEVQKLRFYVDWENPAVDVYQQKSEHLQEAQQERAQAIYDLAVLETGAWMEMEGNPPDEASLERAIQLFQQYGAQYNRDSDRWIEEINRVTLLRNAGRFDQEAEQALQDSQNAFDRTQAQWGEYMWQILDELGPKTRAQIQLLAAQDDYEFRYGDTSGFTPVKQELEGMLGEDLLWELTEFVRQDRNAEKMEREIAESWKFGKEHVALASVAAIPKKLLGGVSGALDAVGQKMGKELRGSYAPVDWNSSRQTMSQQSAAFRGGSAQRLDEIDPSGLASRLHEGLMGVADAAVLAPFGGWGAAIGYMAEANSVMLEAKQRGATDDQALSLGVLSSVTAAVVDQLPIDEVFRASDGKTVREMLERAVNQAYPAASRELVSGTVDLLADQVIMGEKSQYEQLKQGYLNAGLNEDQAAAEAFCQLVGDVCMDALRSSAAEALSVVAKETGKAAWDWGAGRVAQGKAPAAKGSTPVETVLMAMTRSQQENYSRYIEPAGVSAELYLDVLGMREALRAGDPNASAIPGKTIPNKMAWYLDGLRLRKKQKRALWRALGYADNSCPW